MAKKEDELTPMERETGYYIGRLTRECFPRLSARKTEEMLATQKEEAHKALAVVSNVYREARGFPRIGLPVNRNEVFRLAQLVLDQQRVGQKIPIFIPGCPEYSYEVTSSGPRYNFKKLGSGVSLNVRDLFDVTPELLYVLQEAGIASSAVERRIAVADIEAEDEVILKAMHISEESFRGCVKESAESIYRLALGDQSFTNIALMSEYLTSDDYERAQRVLANNVRSGQIANVVQARADLYGRFFGRAFEIPGMKYDQYQAFLEERAKADIGRYLTFGSMVRRQGGVILEATAPSIATLYNLGDDLPVAPVIMVRGESH